MISIIIPVYNKNIEQHTMTDECIESILRSMDSETFEIAGECEIIIVDNGSNPVYSSDFESSFATIKVIRNETNTGFPAAVNQGIKASKGDYICLLNNDTVVTQSWLSRLVKCLDDYDIVSPVTNFSAGRQRVRTVSYDDEETLNIAAEKWHQANKGNIQEVNFVIGFCMLFERELYNLLGEFDESMFPCSGEELDFCFRCRSAGGRVAIVRDVYIHHYGSQTFTAMQNAGELNYQKICDACTKNVAKRWGCDFWDKQADLNYPIYDRTDGHIEIKAKDSTQKLRLNLGCGRYKLDGFINIDSEESVNPDLISDALDLPFQVNSVDEIYCGHMLEHLTLEEGKKALRYWKSLLVEGGIITITVPDMDYIFEEYIKISPDERAMRLIELNDTYIFSYCQKSHHKYCYNPALLKLVMKDAGFRELKRLPFEHQYFVSPVKWQVAYQGTKGRKA